MIYVDTSAVVALLVGEVSTPAVVEWYEAESRPLIAGDWLVTEMASALALKVRTHQITQALADAAWDEFEYLTAGGLQLVALSRDTFTQAAAMVRSSSDGLRAGDALHLALAATAHVEALASLDRRLIQHANAIGLSTVTLA
jgi:predicted nucleic acid-binding protein